MGTLALEEIHKENSAFKFNESAGLRLMKSLAKV
jgi:hypothetical protein